MKAILASVLQRQAKLAAAMKSGDGFSSPSLLRNHLFVTGKDALGYNDGDGGLLVPSIDEGKMYARFVVTRAIVDREGDFVVPAGCLALNGDGKPHLDNFRRNPVWMFGHQLVSGMPLPVGSGANPDTGELDFQVFNDRVEAGCWYHGKTSDSIVVFGLVAARVLKATSIGFMPVVAERLGARKGAEGRAGGPGQPTGKLRWLIREWDPLEISNCNTPMNPGVDLISVGLSKGKLFGESLSPDLRKALLPLAVPMSGAEPGGYSAEAGGGLPAVKAMRLVIQKGIAYGQQANNMRWNPELGDGFDVAEQRVEPATMLIDWASRYLRVPVKRIFRTSESIPSVRMGNYLTGMREILAAEFTPEDVRNLHGDYEAPPFYDTIKLNSKRTDTFLLDGTTFYKGQTHGLVVDVTPDWGGISLTYYAPFEHQDKLQNIIASAHEWMKANNFLKGEKFSLSGEFLETTQEDWPDLFLEEINFQPIKRIVERMNKKGKDFLPHGSILSGPPGTGKTLSARIVMNKANATFIWVSARDFHYAGGFGGMTMAFDLAKELAPSVIVFEDVDNWMGESSIDFMKTEMDGVARYKGVWTILTTNFPERLPEALIDRPGRFHDVLQFAVPSAEARKQMLQKWVPGISPAKLLAAVISTDDYSGAHIYHLAAFAKALQESEAINVDESVDLAIEKVREQRELINGIQLEGSRYRPRKEMAAALLVAKERKTPDREIPEDDLNDPECKALLAQIPAQLAKLAKALMMPVDAARP